MTRNGEIIVVGSDDSHVYIYYNNGSSFQPLQTLSNFSTFVDVVDVSSDGSHLLIVDSSQTFVYKYRELKNKYSLHQTIKVDDGSWTVDAGALTDDHQWLIAPQDSGFTYIYKFNNSQYNLYQNLSKVTTYVSSVSITNDHQFLALGTNGTEVLIYKFDGS